MRRLGPGEGRGVHPLGRKMGEGAKAHAPFLSSPARSPLTLSFPLCPSLPTTEVLIPAGGRGPEGARGGRQPKARGQWNGAAL